MNKRLAEILRKAIRESKTSAIALSKVTGVSQPTITEFLNGKDIRLDTAQKLADHFGLTLKKDLA